jgi:cobalt/nickel transport system permease protein
MKREQPALASSPKATAKHGPLHCCPPIHNPQSAIRNHSAFILFLLLLPSSAWAMHISEGILPAPWAGLWFAISIPFLYWGLHDLKIRSRATPEFKAMVGLVGAAVFIISCMPIPVPTAGSCSHPCGTGLAAMLIGPPLTVVVASVALTLQALFLSHGGLTTLGADIVSMGVAGAFIGYGAFHLLRKLSVPIPVAAFVGGMLSDWGTYAVTSFQLASALHGSDPLLKLLIGTFAAFLPTQLPLGILEGFLCAGAYQFVHSRRPDLLKLLTRRTAS